MKALTNRFRIGSRCLYSALLFAIASLLPSQNTAAQNERHIALGEEHSAVKTLNQNWDSDESNWFYNVPQGSRLVPYIWMLHLEQSGNQERLLSIENVRKFGFIPRVPSTENPDGLPIGFVKDAEYDDGSSSLGLTCAACHTGQILHGDTLYLVDGAPSLGDIESLMQELVAALQATTTEEPKFERFAGRVLGGDASMTDKLQLLEEMRSILRERQAYNIRNFPAAGAPRFGFGRVDAFGAILNEVSVNFVGVPENHHPANAPVSYPCLWDAPQHDKVQWNGAAVNKVSELGNILFNTKEVGALGRNAGEVLGVFGSVEIRDREFKVPRRYDSTINKDNLIAIEDSLKTLWSPEWPDDFPPIDSEARERGKLLFQQQGCSACHKAIDRSDPDRTVKAEMHDVGTDPMMVTNFGRIVSTGKLEGRQQTITKFLTKFGEQAPAAILLKHTVERSILRKLGKPELDLLKQKQLALNELNPGFQSTAIIEIGQQKTKALLDSVRTAGEELRIYGEQPEVDQLKESLSELLGPNLGDLLEGLGPGIEELESLPGILGSENKQQENRLSNASVQFAYKARPLNGVWATAPYLHNGSVRSLMDLLRPSDERSQTFHVGSIQFDPIEVGFADDESFPEFDTTLVGNSNAGHEFGINLTETQRMDLVEYLKSL